MNNLKIKAVLILVAVVIAGGFVWQFKKTEKATGEMNEAISRGDVPELDRILTDNPILVQIDYSRIQVTPFDSVARLIDDEEKAIELTKVFLKHGMDFNCKNVFGGTPLHSAVMFGRIKLAEFLIESEADVNATMAIGNTPLHTATNAGNAEIVKMLLAAGAKKDVSNNDGLTPLQMARTKNDDEIISLLEK